MASDEVYGAVRAHLESRWSATPLAWENEAFDPATWVATWGALEAWVAVELAGNVYARQSIGAGSGDRWDEDGTLFMHVFVPAGTGSSIARAHCKALADLFRGTLLMGDALEFMDASIGLGEPGDDEGTTFRISVSVDWRRMEA